MYHSFALIQIPRLSCGSRHETKLKVPYSFFFFWKKKMGSQPPMSICLLCSSYRHGHSGRKGVETTIKPPQPRFTCTAIPTLFWLKIRPKCGSFSDYPARRTRPLSQIATHTNVIQTRGKHHPCRKPGNWGFNKTKA